MEEDGEEEEEGEEDDGSEKFITQEEWDELDVAAKAVAYAWGFRTDPVVEALTTVQGPASLPRAQAAAAQTAAATQEAVTQEAAAQEVSQAAAAQTAAATQDASPRRPLARHPSIDDVMQSLDVGGTDAGAGPSDVAQVLASGIDAMFVGEEITYTNTMCVCTYRIVLIECYRMYVWIYSEL